MNRLFVLCIFLFLLIIGVTLYIHVDTQKFVKNLPQSPKVSASQQKENISSAARGESQQRILEVRERKRFVSQDSVGEKKNISEKEATTKDWRDRDDTSHAHMSDPWQRIPPLPYAEIAADIKRVGFYIDENGKIYTAVPLEDISPEERLSLRKKAFLKRFGDIPEVHTYFDIKQKQLKGEPLTLDEMIFYLSSLNTLFPHPKTQAALEEYKHLKENNVVFEMEYD